MSDQNAVFKAYDVRGRVPEELDEPLAEAIGRAFARLVRRNEPGTDRVALGRDMRPSGVPLAAAFTRGLVAAGLGVLEAADERENECVAITHGDLSWLCRCLSFNRFCKTW